MDKEWNCIDCFELEDGGCFLKTNNDSRPEICPYNGTACNWEEVYEETRGE